jgi:hypothetical protein
MAKRTKYSEAELRVTYTNQIQYRGPCHSNRVLNQQPIVQPLLPSRIAYDKYFASLAPTTGRNPDFIENAENLSSWFINAPSIALDEPLS